MASLKEKLLPSESVGRVKDARGRKVTQLDPVALHLLRRHDVVEADVLRKIAHEKGVRIAGKERVSLILGVAGVLLARQRYEVSNFSALLRRLSYEASLRA